RRASRRWRWTKFRSSAGPTSCRTCSTAMPGRGTASPSHSVSPSCSRTGPRQARGRLFSRRSPPAASACHPRPSRRTAWQRADRTNQRMRDMNFEIGTGQGKSIFELREVIAEGAAFGEEKLTILANGEGPTVLLCGGIHGDEYEPQIVLRRLAEELRPDDV